MLRKSLWETDDDGSAALEFITVGVILLVPFIYLVIVLGAIQEQSLGAEAAARHTARAISLAPDAATAVEHADEVLATVIEEYGMDADSIEVSMVCQPAGAVCPSAGVTMVLTVRGTVSLPFIPPGSGLDDALAVPVEATSVQKISREWGSG